MSDIFWGLFLLVFGIGQVLLSRRIAPRMSTPGDLAAKRRSAIGLGSVLAAIGVLVLLDVISFT
jgi:hypothetical protein